ncbi:hypothetical protein MBLNU230_g7223t1 [Neophaeotheca triangularis]
MQPLLRSCLRQAGTVRTPRPGGLQLQPRTRPCISHAPPRSTHDSSQTRFHSSSSRSNTPTDDAEANNITTSKGNIWADSIRANEEWATRTASENPDFFPKAAKGQSPKILWIGCSDSRMPETTLLGLKPGDVFTHRNIANIVSPTDINMLSVVDFAVKNLKVEHIVVAGHTSCGGVGATLGNAKLGVIDVWLQPMRLLRERHAEELEKLEGMEKSNYLAKLNVQAGVEGLKRISTVIDAMQAGQTQVHGVLLDVATGRLNELEQIEDETAGSNRMKAFLTK